MKKELALMFAVFLLAEVFIFTKYLPGKKENLAIRDNIVRVQKCPVLSDAKSECAQKTEDYKKLKQEIISEFDGKTPKEWGEKVIGVKTRLVTDKKIVALTFDADSGRYDSKLIDYLKSEKVPATLFVTGKWIDEYPDIFQELSKDPLFEIENHGSNHKPCSMNGRSAYGIRGTENASDVFYEIEQNARKIETLIGKKPKFYRPGTAYLDEVCAQIAEKLGYEVVGYNVLGDAGATFSADKIKAELLSSKNGSIALLHMNHPEKDVAKGVAAAIPEMKKLEFEFVKLSDYELK